MSLQSLAHDLPVRARSRRERAVRNPSRASEAILKRAVPDVALEAGSMRVLEATVALAAIATALLIGAR